MIYYGQITYSEEFEGTKRCVESAVNHIDRFIVVDDGSLSNEQKNSLMQYGIVTLVTEQWQDDFPRFREYYLDTARAIARKHNDACPWMVVSDSDEYFNNAFLRDLRAITSDMAKAGHDMAGINCRDAFTAVEWLDSLDRLKELPSEGRRGGFYKDLLFKLYPDLRYEGAGNIGLVHETFNRQRWNTINLPADKYWYTHEKSSLKIWLRAAMNFFIGGGGDNVGEQNVHWKPFRELCAKHGIHTSAQFKNALRGSLPDEIVSCLVEFLWVSPTNYGTEMRETAKFFFILHPEKRTHEIEERLKNPPPMAVIDQVRAFIVRAYIECLGRHADEEGLNNYVSLIMNNKMSKDELYNILHNSPEYKQKFGG